MNAPTKADLGYRPSKKSIKRIVVRDQRKRERKKKKAIEHRK